MTSRDALDPFVERAKSLYSLPAVAMEVLRLTDHPKVDVPALKNCIENDPALTTKLLRVVNSSLFGLSREVNDLNQALALLGIKPLKLLVL
ncbi:MAG: HDOD domain-containing protein, partial [Planctomycetes bacterium]|nr:HDOD domain-containing protein [Planctomycetota bacterium]